MSVSRGRRTFVFAGLGWMLSNELSAPAVAGKPLRVHIQVIQVSRKTKGFDPRIAKLQKNLPGWTGAKLVDEVRPTLAGPGARASLEVMNKSKKLEVQLIAFDEKTGEVKLSLEIKALKFSTKTTHKKKNATVFVGHQTGKDEGVFLAVTPEF